MQLISSRERTRHSFIGVTMSCNVSLISTSILQELQAEVDKQRNQLAELRQALERITSERDALRTEVGELKGILELDN